MICDDHDGDRSEGSSSSLMNKRRPHALQYGSTNDVNRAIPEPFPDSELEVDSNGGNSPGSSDLQDGVRGMAAVSKTWSKLGLTIAYASLFLMTISTSLEGQVTSSLAAFAVSSFNNHSLISMVFVVQGVVNAVIKPPMAKIADAFGRLEAFTISIGLYVAGYVLMAASHNVQVYTSAQIFYSAGNTGLQILQQVFIADTSDLRNRALLSSLPQVPFLATVWVGPVIASAILAANAWRWGFGMWAIILPTAFLPLALSLYINSQKARRLGLLRSRKPRFDGGDIVGSLRRLSRDLDVGGIALLTSGFTLILVPMTLASSVSGGWSNRGLIGTLVLGFGLLAAFPAWEASPRCAPHPLVPLNLFGSRTFCAGLVVAFFYFMIFYLSVQPYFYSYLLVVQNRPVATAGQITQIFSFAATISSVSISLVIKYMRHFKWFVVTGSCIYLLGILLMIFYRTASASLLSTVTSQVLVGSGVGMLNVPAQLGTQASTAFTSPQPGAQLAAATAAFLTSVEIGGAVGAAISGAIWGRLVPAKLEMYLPEGAKQNATEIYGSVNVALRYEWGTPEREAIGRAYQEAMTAILWVAACMCVPLICFALCMEDYKLDEIDKGVKGRVVIGGEARMRVEGRGARDDEEGDEEEVQDLIRRAT